MVWRCVCLWMLGMMAVVATMAVAEPQPSTALLERRQFADGLYSRRMYDLAAREYRALLEAAPDAADNDVVAFRLGECLRLAGKLSEAAEQFSRLFVSYPASPYRLRAAYRRARLYMETGDHAGAIGHFRAILKEKGLEPSLAAACLYHMADALAEVDRNTEALESFGELAATFADSSYMPYARMREAEVRRRGLAALSGDVRSREADRILALYGAVLEGPEEGRLAAEALFQMAEMHFGDKAYRRSAEYYRRLLRDYPDDQRVAEARLQAAWSASHAGLHADALAIVEEELKGGAPGERHIEWLYLKANCQRLLSKLDVAVQTYQTVIEREPRGRFADAARYEMALAYMKQGRHAEAVAAAESIALTDALRLDVAWLLAECHKELGQTEKAIQYYRIVEREAPAGDLACDATYRLAYTLQQVESWREASDFYNRLVTRFPDHKSAPQALFASAICLQRAGDLAGAARDWTRLAQTYKSHALVEESLYQGAMAQMRLGADDSAVALLDDLIRSHGSGAYGADARYWRGMLWKRAGKPAEAAELLARAMADGSGEIADLARYNLALIRREQGKDEEAATLLRELLGTPIAKRFPAPLIEWLAIHFYAHKNYTEAAAAARQLKACHPEAIWQQAGWCLAGRAEAALGHTAAAREAFEAALRESASTEYGAEAALRLADLAFAEKAYEEAIQHYDKAISLAASEKTLGIRARGFFGSGRAAAALGRFDEAARGFMMVAILYDDPELVPEALHGAIVAFMELDRETEAQDAIGELLMRYPDSPWAERAGKLLSSEAVTPQPDAAAGNAVVDTHGDVTDE